jgi:hypothetical protein
MHPEERAREDEGGPSTTETSYDLISAGGKMLQKETVREFGGETSAEQTGYRPPFDMSPETVKGPPPEETSEMQHHAGPLLSSESGAHSQRELEREISDGDAGNDDDDPLAKFRPEKTSSDDDDALAKFRSQTTLASQTHLLQRPTSPPEGEYRDRRQNVKNKEMSAMDPHFEPEHPHGKFVQNSPFLCFPLIWQRNVTPPPASGSHLLC